MSADFLPLIPSVTIDLIEYRVRPVTRYIVTRHEKRTDPRFDTPARSQTVEKGAFDRPDLAFEIAYALCKDEHDRLGWTPGDERIQYPKGTPQDPEHEPKFYSGFEELAMSTTHTTREMRAKMRITDIKRYPEPTTKQLVEGVVPETTQENLTFHAVSKNGSYPADGSDEDNSYARFSPAGAMTLTVANPALLGKFAIGDTFYLDFHKISE